MRHVVSVLPALVLTTVVAAQDRGEEKDPMVLVARAEALLKQKNTEPAVLLLWSAQALLATLPKLGMNESVAMSARQLLAASDPLDARRRAVWTSIGKQMVELASLYRSKKWFDVAASRLEIAERYDAETAAKERTLLEAARPKDQPAPKGDATKSKLAPMLQRANAIYTDGEWREADAFLECAPLQPGKQATWTTRAAHADHEIVVEFRSTDPTKDHNAVLAFGLSPAEQSMHDGYRLNVQYFPETSEFGIYLYSVKGMEVTKIAPDHFVAAPSTGDGFHRLAVRVKGRRVHAQLDGTKPLEAEMSNDVRGRVGLLSGISNRATCGMQFRAFRVDPLPADMPTDEELRAKAAVETQNAITRAVDEAKALIAKKQPEPASVLLRDALTRIRSISAGILRDNLEKSVEQLLNQTDSYAARRKKTAQTIAAELVTLADEYEKAGLARSAEIVVRHALQFDPSLTARETAARAAVQKWNAAQAAARASELAPPDDDGSAMREWFANGQKLFRNGPAVVLEGAAARAENLQDDAPAYWLAAPGSKPLIKASVSVHLPAAGTQAGLCFDVVPEQGAFCLAALSRTDNGLRLITYLQDGKDWTPLQQHDVPMDEWRLDGWHRVSVVSNAEGMVVRCNGTEIKVARNRLGKPTGRFALFASNASSQPRAIELRAFRADP